ncbi:hypothetical protein BG60_11185 [Caballeronia zhejiangensis]|uniref:Uncharacterized protein n=1 Tax=Caballeronia zhejiangensis TaxID=871203 RepID=A0A656QE15_9BURK|nr:hypothetical protein BG60_11185 [Caballeronia zhejiangensis]
MYTPIQDRSVARQSAVVRRTGQPVPHAARRFPGSTQVFVLRFHTDEMSLRGAIACYARGRSPRGVLPRA